MRLISWQAGFPSLGSGIFGQQRGLAPQSPPLSPPVSQQVHGLGWATSDGFCVCPRGPGALTLRLGFCLFSLSLVSRGGGRGQAGGSNMAQSKRHVYSRVSGSDLRWPWEGCWERPGACGHGCGGWGDRLELGRGHSQP